MEKIPPFITSEHLQILRNRLFYCTTLLAAGIAGGTAVEFLNQSSLAQAQTQNPTQRECSFAGFTTAEQSPNGFTGEGPNPITFRLVEENGNDYCFVINQNVDGVDTFVGELVLRTGVDATAELVIGNQEVVDSTWISITLKSLPDASGVKSDVAQGNFRITNTEAIAEFLLHDQGVIGAIVNIHNETPEDLTTQAEPTEF
jgi:hypothetical protein